MVVGEHQKVLKHVSLMVKNIDLDTKINILSYLGTKIVPLSGPGPCCCHCCWCTLGSSETCSSQLIMVKNIYLDTKINLLRCLGVELHLEVALDPVVCIVIGIEVHQAVLKPVPINSAWSKTYTWTPSLVKT